MIVEPFHHENVEIGLKSFCDLFCKLWPSLQFDKFPKLQTLDLTNLDLIIIILFEYWIMWWTWTSNLVVFIVVHVWCCVCFIVCWVVIYCVCLYCLEWSECSKLRWKECASNDKFFKGKWCSLHKFLSILICIVVYFFLVELHVRFYHYAMLDLFSTTPNNPKCLVPIQYLSRSIEMLCYVFYDEKLISTKLNKHLGGIGLLYWRWSWVATRGHVYGFTRVCALVDGLPGTKRFEVTPCEDCLQCSHLVLWLCLD